MASVELEGQREVQALLDTPRELRSFSSQAAAFIRCVCVCVCVGVSTKRGSGVVERLQEKQRERLVVAMSSDQTHPVSV